MFVNAESSYSLGFRPHISIIVVCTYKCRLKCLYCYNKGQKNSLTITFDLLELLFKKLSKEGISDIRFIWHGGDIFTLGEEFFKKVILLEEKYIPNQIVQNSLQTNGYLIDEKILSVLLKHDFNIGVSLDGPKEIHDFQRPTKDGISSFEQAVEFLNLLRKFNKKKNILTVITSYSAKMAKEIFEFFVSEEINGIKFLPCTYESPGKSSLFVSSKDYGNFLSEIADLWLHYDNPNIHIFNFEDIIKVMLKRSPSDCSRSGACFTNVICILPNGDLYPCTRFIGNDDFYLGNVGKDSFTEILTNLKLIGLKKNEHLTSCLKCKWYFVCKGGCSFHRFLKASDLSKPSYYCYSYRRLFEKFGLWLQRIRKKTTKASNQDIMSDSKKINKLDKKLNLHKIVRYGKKKLEYI